MMTQARGGEAQEEGGDMTTSLSEVAFAVEKESRAHAVTMMAAAMRVGRKGMWGGRGRKEGKQMRKTAENTAEARGIVTRRDGTGAA
jgi:hypothetical protein